MATPHVAGAIAYFASTNDTETALERKNRILNNVDVLPQLNGIVSTGGRLNINNVLNTADYQNELDQIVGEWTMNYNWISGTTLLTFNEDFTFSNDEGYYGTWSYNGNSINMFYSNGTTYYTTNVDLESGTMSGVMTSVNGYNGTWDATKISNANDNYDEKLRADFNGDGRDDVLVQRKSDGMLVTMITNANGGLSVEHEWAAKPDAQWSVLNTADFNGDGREDVLVQRKSDGMLVTMISAANGDLAAQRWLSAKPTSSWKIFQ